MCKILYFVILLLILTSCTSNNGISKFQDAESDIQSYAEKHITAEWFAVLEPVSLIVVTDVEIKKAKVQIEDDRSALLTVELTGYYTPMATQDKSDNRHFKLTKKFDVTRVTYGKDVQYSVKLAEN